MYVKISLVALLLFVSGCSSNKYIYKNDVHTKKAVSILIDKVVNLESDIKTISGNSLCNISTTSKNVVDKDILKDDNSKNIKSNSKREIEDPILDPVYFSNAVKRNVVELDAKNKRIVNIKPYNVITEYVNVRSSKYKNNSKNIVDVLPKGEPVYVTKITDGWAKIGTKRWLRVSTIKPRNR